MLTACAHHTSPMCCSNSPGDSPPPVTQTGVTHVHPDQAHRIHGIHLLFGQDHDGLETTEPPPACSGWEIMHSFFPNCLPSAPKLRAERGRCCRCAIKSRAIILLIPSAPSGPCYICQPPCPGTHTVPVNFRFCYKFTKTCLSAPKTARIFKAGERITCIFTW